jgi:hypothetical protein
MSDRDKPNVQRLARRLCLAIAAIPAAYVASYFVLGRHETGETFVLGHPVTEHFRYHDREFPFDPWIYRPLARFEYWLRGKQTQIVIEEDYRGGQPHYDYGPFE